MPSFIDLIGEAAQFNLPEMFTVAVYGVVGLLLMFFGLKVVRLWLGIAGLAGGAYLGIIIANLLKLDNTAGWAVVALVAIAGAFLLALAYKLCFFAGGFIAGIYFGQYLLKAFMPDYNQYVLLGFALLAGILAAFFRFGFTILVTALTGSLLISDIIVSFVYDQKPGDLIFRVQSLNFDLKEDLIVLLIIACFAAIGALVQMRQSRRRARVFRR